MRSLTEHTFRQGHKCDVLVVGSGISGALAAEALTEAGLSVTVVDKRSPVTGSTQASTALLQYEIDTPLNKLADQIGLARAQRIWRRSRLALLALEERAERLKINADLTRRTSLYLEGDKLNADALLKENLARRETGFETVFLPRAEVKARYGITGRSAILSFGNLTADPRRLAAEFLRVAIERGARLFSGLEVSGLEHKNNHVFVTMTDGRVIAANSVIFATGYALTKGIPRKNHFIASTFAFATYPQHCRLWPGECLIWEASDPYLYLRSAPDGSVICGGEDEEFEDAEKRDKMMPEKIETLQKKLAALLPKLDTRPAFVWSGSFGASRTGTPTIGRIPRMPNCYAVLGYGGNGITFSMMAAQMLTTEITGGSNPDADLFSFYRKF